MLTTPDANRTFLSYLGTAQELALSPAAEAAIRGSRMVALEGYLWEMPNAAASIQRAIEVAHSAGTMVALTAGDANVVGRHREDIWRALNGGVDLLFANRSVLLTMQMPVSSLCAMTRFWCVLRSSMRHTVLCTGMKSTAA